MRPIVVGYPSRKVKVVLWEGTDDAQAFEVKSLKCGKPYAQAFGVKHFLTDQEAKIAKQMAGLI